MLSLRVSRSSLVAVTLLAVIAATTPLARADVMQPTPSLPPTAGSYTIGTVCVNLGVSSGICVVGTGLGNFTGTTSTFPLPGQAVDSFATLTSKVYTDSGGVPGAFLGALTLTGPIGFLYAGRTIDTELGTFPSSLTELDLMGAFSGHSIVLMLNPAMPSTGITTVSQVPGVQPPGGQPGGEFRISSFFDVFVELSLDGGPFVPRPEGRTFTLTPEPGSISLLVLGLAGVAGRLRQRVRAI